MLKNRVPVILFLGASLLIGSLAASPALLSVAPHQMPDELRVLIENLKSGSGDAHLAAAKTLREMGGRAASAVPALIEVLGMGKFYWDGLDSQGRMTGGSIDYSGSAATILTAIGRPAVDPLLRVLKEAPRPGSRDRQNIKAEAIRVLGMIKDERAVEALAQCLKDPTPDVSAAAARALLAFEKPGILDSLQTALASPNPDFRDIVAWMFIQKKDPRVFPYIQKKLQSPYPDIREAGCSDLEAFGDARTIPMLTGLLDKDPDADVKSKAARILGDLGNPAAVEALTRLLKDSEPQVREAAAAALKRINAKAPVQAIPQSSSQAQIQPPAKPQSQSPGPPQQPRPPTPADILRGAYGPYRANNDLLSYDLDIRVDPEQKSIAGNNRITFRMLKDDSRIQLDLTAGLNVERILLGATELKYTREFDAVFVDFPAPLKKGEVVAVDFHYSGRPAETGRFGGITFRKDPAGRPWITTACQGPGAMVWWPNKEQQRDEVENMTLRVAIPNALTDISNGRLEKKTDLGDGYTRWDWVVHYPINNYCVALNIGSYTHFSDELGGLTLDFYCLPENLDKAKLQFAQAKPMIACFQKYFGDYPFKKDGYKLIEVPYSGMEHQTAVSYGNRFANGYLERDWTGVGVSLKFDFIIIHESAHEWFGNSVTAADVCDEWIHEGWGTYAEVVYVEELFGREDAQKYINGYKSKVRNRQPIITPPGVHATPPQDMYFKGALFLNTLRSVVDDDARWWKLVRDFYGRFRYQNIATEDVVKFFNDQMGQNLTPIFDQYLRHTAIPALELQFNEAEGRVSYRWKTDEPAFAMPVKVGRKDRWQTIRPSTEWQTMATDVKKDEFEAATDLYYINVVK